MKQIHRRRAGTAALQEIRKYQESSNLFIPKCLFGRVARKLLQQLKPDMRMCSAAVALLHETAEVYLVDLFQDTYVGATHGNHATISTRDIQLARRIRG